MKLSQSDMQGDKSNNNIINHLKLNNNIRKKADQEQINKLHKNDEYLKYTEKTQPNTMKQDIVRWNDRKIVIHIDANLITHGVWNMRDHLCDKEEEIDAQAT